MAGEENWLWVFHGEGAKFAVSVYDTVDEAERNILENGMSGVLTAYPKNETVYEYCVRKGLFKPKSEKTGKLIQRFTSAYLDHFHFENGERKKA